MQVTSLFHISIKTARPGATKRFYGEVLGMTEAPRPPFEFPGFWLQMNTSYGGVPIHFYTGTAALDEDGSVPFGSGAVDHIALTAHGFEDMRLRCQRLGVPYRERTVPSLTLCQLFFYDPNGVQLEINFNALSEQPAPDIDPSNFPPAGARWFQAAAYSRWNETAHDGLAEGKKQ